MDIKFRVGIRVDKPVPEVFRAVVEPELLKSYFVAAASGPLEEGRRVKWTWADGEEEPIQVDEIVLDKCLVFGWKAFQVPTFTRVKIQVDPHPKGGTKVTISESGWEDDQAALDSAFEHCSGWMHMLMCLKARLEHDIDLRG